MRKCLLEALRELSRFKTRLEKFELTLRFACWEVVKIVVLRCDL